LPVNGPEFATANPQLKFPNLKELLAKIKRFYILFPQMRLCEIPHKPINVYVFNPQIKIETARLCFPKD